MPKVIESLTEAIESADRAIEKFQAKLDSDPAYALEWSTGAFEAAAKKKVYSQVLAWAQAATATEEEDLRDKMGPYLVEQALNMASYIANKSTSPVSNLLKEYELQAWSKVTLFFSQKSSLL